MNPSQQRIQLIGHSRRCFIHGLCSLIPFAGFIFFLASANYFHRARRQQADWNPAQSYLVTGLTLGLLGGILSVVEISALFLSI